ncbi:hypothetical protein LINPERHAP1_LOCUS24562 [Linum perenne]
MQPSISSSCVLAFSRLSRCLGSSITRSVWKSRPSE